ncbi:HlyD family efflux transporter periplasmic adaptor subunit [Desulfovibrio sp. JC022]|uniref:HlyD family efflux transporter periplasmic adaptor subunit n=1 Tax=Desulfovibrio sp. JC022 TaxID=2593642 RepID=UPI0013CF5016|nr:HlyD family efflux transporter periplasmic adaptor subunit [Desulfovibrio sp. JC022]NDV24266.1 HlyD family secretion protein [Desulfovibrio sp. JC022]
MRSPELETRKRVLNARCHLLQKLIKRSAGSVRELESINVLQQQLSEVDSQLFGINKQLEQLVIKAPFSGKYSVSEPLRTGQWISIKTKLGAVSTEEGTRFEAYVEERELGRIRLGARGTFLADTGSWKWIPVHVTSIDPVPVDTLDDRMLATIHGGAISARPGELGKLVPESATYRIELQSDAQIISPVWVSGGALRLEGEKASFAGRFFRYVAAVLIRETGF